MSKYVVLIKYKKNNSYSGKQNKPYYCILFHGSTKYPENYPYFSANISKKTVERYAVDKENIDELFSMAKHLKTYSQKKLESKQGKIFILKANSSKLKDIISISK